jgi:uncharacterized protein (TIGR02453 family)
MRSGYAGFPVEAMTFFRDLEKNNNREWFQARKPVYEANVRAPMEELVTAINQEMVRFAPDYMVEPRKAIYRIYRDTRFSADKTPYKTHIAAVFPRRGLEKHAGAGLYFSVSAKEIEVAGGVYMPGAEQLLAIRSHLSQHHEEFRRIIRAKTLRSLMGELQGNQLSRVPKGYRPDHPAADMVRYKQWLLYVLLEPELATTARLLAEIVKRFRAMIPFVEYLNAPLRRRSKDLATMTI